MLAEGRVDLVLTDFLEAERPEMGAYAQAHGLELAELRGDTYKIAVGKNRPLAAQKELRVQDVKGLSLACYVGGDTAAEQYFQRFFDRANRVEYTSIERMVQTARDGPGVSVLPEWSIQTGLCLSGEGRDALRFFVVEGFCVPFVHAVAFSGKRAKTKEMDLVLQKIQGFFQRNRAQRPAGRGERDLPLGAGYGILAIFQNAAEKGS